MTEYFIPTNAAESEFVEKRSRFIGQIKPVETEAAARAFIEEIKKKHYDARHNCWCYLLRDGAITRYSDDGEPQGTAGLPMLGVFEKAGVTNLVCVVTRYFGGTLLGAGGLVRAYTRSCSDALNVSGISVVRRWVRCEMHCSYSLYERLTRECVALGAMTENADYGADILLTVLVPEENWDAFSARIYDMTSGNVTPNAIGEEMKPVPLTAKQS